MILDTLYITLIAFVYSLFTPFFFFLDFKEERGKGVLGQNLKKVQLPQNLNLDRYFKQGVWKRH